MYEWRESFSLLAELAIAVVGFSGIIGAFYSNSRISKTSRAYLDIYYLLAYGIPVLFGSLVPFIVFDWVMDEKTAWRICSAIFLSFGVISGVVFRKENRALLEQGRAQFIAMGSGDLVSGLLLIANISGLFFEPSGRIYAVVLFWSFLGSIVGFTKVVSHTWTRKEQGDN
jgi:hypothetical protein